MLGLFITLILVCVIIYAIINKYTEQLTLLFIAAGIWYIGYKLGDIAEILHKILLK